MPGVLWALGFGNPLLAYGLAGASIPIVIHLLNRRKFRETYWAAMQFLLAAIRKNYRRIRIEQWILLAVRTLVVLLVALAMMKPYLESMGAIPVLVGQRTHRVLVLDGSLSMAYAPAEATRFDQAKALAAQLVKDSRRGDVLSVVLMGDPPRVVVGDPSANQQAVLKEIDEITLPHGGTDLTATFEAIDRVLAASSIHQKEVVFLTDLQTASWKPAPGSADGLKRVLARLEARRPRSVVIDLGKPGGENRALTDLHLSAPIVTLGSSTLVHAAVRNFGPGPINAARVRLLIDGQVGPETSIDVLPVGDDVPVAFAYTFGSPGDHLIEAQIDDDPLKLDNHRWLAVPVREYLRVLLVDGDPKPQPFDDETGYLDQALNPTSDSPGTTSTIKTEVVPESALSRRDLAPYDAVLVCNMAQFTSAEVAALDAYLKQGGGVVFFSGDQVVPDNYNRLLFADGKGLLPAALGPMVGSAETRGQEAFVFNPLNYAHTIVAPFGGAAPSVTAGLTEARTWQYYKLKLPKGSAAKVALAFSTGDPAIVEAPRQRGVVVQVATSADAGWTSWPLHQSYPPVMERIVLQAASGRMTERNIRVGQPLDQALPASGTGAPVTVLRPDGRALPSKLKAFGDVSQLHFEDTELSGPYQVRIGPPLAVDSTFTANPDPAESNPAKLDQQGLQEAVPGWNFAYFTDWQRLTRNATAVSQRGELHQHLLYAVLALLLVESVLAWLFGHHATRGASPARRSVPAGSEVA